jgi:hypothetical protein
MKVKKKPESFCILGYLVKVIVKFWQFEKHLIGNLASLGHFFHKKSFL